MFFISQSHPLRLTRNHSNEIKALAVGKWRGGIGDVPKRASISQANKYTVSEENQSYEEGLVELEC